MKHSISLLSLSLLAAVLMTACTPREESHTTPSITLTYFICDPVYDESGAIIGGSDTLGWNYDEELNTYILDTLYMADSTQVIFAAGFRSFDNNLVSTSFEYDTTQLALQLYLTDEILAATTAKTDVSKGILYFNLGFNYVGFPVTYTPRTTGDIRLSVKVESDAGESYSPAYIHLMQPVR